MSSLGDGRLRPASWPADSLFGKGIDGPFVGTKLYQPRCGPNRGYLLNSDVTLTIISVPGTDSKW